MHSLTHSTAVVRASRTFWSVLVIAAAVAVGFFFDCTPVYAQTTYYVAKTGSDGYPGTQSQPFLTIQKAANIVNPGDTVLVGDGTYTMTAGNACGSAVVCLTRGGTSSAWVTFRSINREGAKLNGQSNSVRYGFEFQSSANYIRIDGFEVYGMGYAGGDASGFVIYNAGHDVVISHNNIHDIGRLCTDTTNGETGIFLANPNVTVDSNKIHDIGRFAPGENGCSPSTSYYTNHDHGIYVDGNVTAAGANNPMIRNNVFWNNARGWSIQVYPGAIANLSILNNTFVNPNPYSDGHIIIGANTSNGRITDNIFYKPTRAGIDFYAGSASNLVVANNISTTAIGNATPSGVSFSNNLANTDPQLDSSYRPASTSLAIDRGQTLGDVTLDITGMTRPQGAASDIGAYEYAGSGGTIPPPPPAAPTGLSATTASSSAITLRWTDTSSSESGFKVQRSLDGVTFTQVATLGAGVITYGDSGLAAGTTYFYEVCAYNAGGNSPYSNTASATTTAAAVTPPAAPASLAATATSSSAISLSWTDNSSNESGFKLERSLDGTSFALLATLGGSVTSYGDSGLSAATKYYYRVYAYNSGGNSGYSNTASATTPTATAPPPSGGGATYYVAPTGSDSNPGTSSQPFRTIQHAADLVNPGDTVLVGDGTYTMTAGNACGSAAVCLSRGGTGSAWVTFRSVNQQGAKIDGQSNSTRYGFQFQSTANYIRIEGFEVYGMGYASGDASGFVIYDGGHDVVIAHNDIHDIGRLCTDTGNGETGIFIENGNVTVDSNTIHDIGRYAPGENGCSPSTANYTNHDHGVYVDGNSSSSAPGGNNVMIRNNIFWNNKRGWSIQVYPGSVSNLSILNNTFAYANPYSVGHIIIGANTTNARIIDNVFHQPTTAGIDFYSGTATGMVVANNLSTNAIGSATPAGVSFSNNLANTDPKLDSSLRPTSTSPAIDRGQTLAEVAVDIGGVARPQGASSDIGADEYAGGSTPQTPAAPTSLAANATSSSAISLAWTDNATNETGFKVERSPDGATFTQVATTAAGTSGYSDNGLAAGTKYYYRVCAYNSAGDSADSNMAAATTPAAVTAPAAPGNLAATATSSTAIALSWTDNAANESGFKLERSLDGTTFSPLATLGTNATSYGDSGLTAATKYYYRVYAYNSAGNSAYSNVASATTPAQTVPPPSDTTKPAVAITSPANGATVDHRVTVAATASDNVGVVSVQFMIDGQLIATDTGTPYSTAYNFQKVSRGAHTVSVIATDAAGNAATATITVYR